MANVTDEAIWSEGAEVVINDTSGLTVVDGAYTAAATTNLSITNLESRQSIDVAGSFTFAAAPAAVDKTVDLYFRFLNIDGTNDEPAPDADFDPHFAGSFELDPAAGVLTHYWLLEDVPAPKPSRTVEVYCKNQSGQTLNAFKLAITPATFVPFSA